MQIDICNSHTEFPQAAARRAPALPHAAAAAAAAAAPRKCDWREGRCLSSSLSVRRATTALPLACSAAGHEERPPKEEGERERLAARERKGRGEGRERRG